MNHILLTTLASVAFTLATVSQSAANPAMQDPSHTAKPAGHEHVGPMPVGKSAEDMAKDFENRLASLKDSAANLSEEMKAEISYYIDVIAAEIKALRDPHNKHHKKHQSLGQRALHAAESMVKKVKHQAEHLQKVEERKSAKAAKVEERKARAAERKAKADARKAEREAARAMKKADKSDSIANAQEKATERAHEKEMEKEQAADIAKEEKLGKLDHGRSEGGSSAEPGTEAAKPASEEKK